MNEILKKMVSCGSGILPRSSRLESRSHKQMNELPFRTKMALGALPCFLRTHQD
jgi:hypothetical protein